MGLLDNLATTLISRSTGFDRRMTRRFVRRAGGGKLLMLGGALLAGAMGSEAMGQKEQSRPTPSAPNVPPPPPGSGAPPPPPAPPTEELPPLPPLPEEADEVEVSEATLPSETLYAVVRTMVAAALADGTLSSEEKRAVDGQLASTEELTPDQQRQIHRDLVVPPSPADLAGLPGAGEEPALLFRFAVLVLEADGETSDPEREWLDRLGDALDLDPDRRRALEEEVVGQDVQT